jgi:hypothetical protein
VRIGRHILQVKASTVFGKTHLLRELRLRLKRIWVIVVAGLLLLILILPQLALADPGDSISLLPSSGHCTDLIKARATVTVAGTYRICWNSRTPEYCVGTFTADAAGNHTIAFYVPETVKGTYTVYLTREDYSELAYTDFVVSPSVQIDPEEGPVGTEVTLNGYGFAASQDIQVSFLDTVDTDTANTVGSWEVSHTIPPTPGGNYTFEVEFKEGAIWYDLAGKDFTVTPEITAPSSGTVGHAIEISGTGFASEEEDVEVTFDGKVVEPNTPIVVDEDGSWEATIVIPPLARGTHTIDASGKSTVASDVPDVKVTVGAGILVEQISAYVGDTITVAGGGFATRETGIKITLDGTVVTPAITAKIDGTWKSSFVLPASSYGSHAVGASGDITTAVTTTLNTKARIEELSPVQGAPGDSVSLTGSGFSGVQRLTVTVGGVAASESTQTQANGNVVINFRVPASPEGKQTVTATDDGGASASAYFTVNKKVLPTPLLTSPEDESTLRSAQVTFHWLTSGSDVTYTLEISEVASFTSIFQPRSGIGESSYTLTEEEALPKGTYYWRVKAVDGYGNESPWSDSRRFAVSPIPIWVWVVVGVVVLVVLMVVAYRETKFKVTE